MMQTLFWKAAAPIVCALMTASCAGSSRISPVAPARLILPETASRPCALATLPAENADACMEELKSLGYERTAIIGDVLPKSDRLEPVTIRVSAMNA